MNELKIIQSLYKKKQFPLDDCFFREGTLYTTDSLVENTHFLHTWSTPQNLARKLLHVNVSDILSSGGIPTFCFLNLGLSPLSSQPKWIGSFSRTLKKELDTLGIELVGGDTYASPHTNLSLTLLGKTKKPILRTGGNVRETLYLTGALGYSLLGLKLLQKKIRNSVPKDVQRLALKKHLEPRASIERFPKIILKHKVSAAMDITDGLIQDAGKLETASGLGLEIHLDQLPERKALETYLSMEEIMTSGEELEILFLSKDKISPEMATNIGMSIPGKKGKYMMEGKPFFPKEKGYLHF
jgi:thiamine-monophosphate kinase